jgi:hypothetical protein
MEKQQQAIVDRFWDVTMASVRWNRGTVMSETMKYIVSEFSKEAGYDKEDSSQ